MSVACASNEDIRRSVDRRDRGQGLWPTPADVPDLDDLRDPDYTDEDRAANEQLRQEIEDECDRSGDDSYDRQVQDEDVIWKCLRDDWYVLVGERCSTCGRTRRHATAQDDADPDLW